MVERVILIVGMPGSGKTQLGNKMIEEIEDSVFFDSVTNDAEMEHIKNACSSYKTVIMASPFMCVDNARERAAKFFKEINKKVKITWKFFDYDVNGCINNHPTFKKLIFQVAEHYTIPPRTKKLKVEPYDRYSEEAIKCSDETEES